MGAVARKPTTKRCNTETEAAKQLFLYGAGDGVRVLDLEELSQRSGASISSIRYWMNGWIEEYESLVKSTSMLANAGKTAFQEPLSIVPVIDPKQVDLDNHRKDIEFFRSEFDKLQDEVRDLPQIISELEEILKAFASDPEKFESALQLFDRYLRLSMNRKSLLKQCVEMKRIWDEKVGIDSLKSIQEAQGKAYAVALAKSGVPDAEPLKEAVNESGVFERRG